MTAPTALVVSKLLYPETEVPLTAGSMGMDVDITYVDVIDQLLRERLTGQNWQLTCVDMAQITAPERRLS